VIVPNLLRYISFELRFVDIQINDTIIMTTVRDTIVSYYFSTFKEIMSTLLISMLLMVIC